MKRKAQSDNKAELLQLLELEGFAGKHITVKLCLNSDGKIVFAELLPETTLEVPRHKAKAVLKTFYGLEFGEGPKREDCGVYVVH